jgi:hypothetical protein
MEVLCAAEFGAWTAQRAIPTGFREPSHLAGSFVFQGKQCNLGSDLQDALAWVDSEK